MKRSFTDKRLLAALALILFANAVVFARVAYNRTGEPELFTFTERELGIPGRYFRNRENSGLTLRLDWHGTPPDPLKDDRYRAYRRTIDVAPATLRAFGYPTEPECGRADRRRYRPADNAWIALEYNGPAYRQYVAALKARLADKRAEVGPDPAAAAERQLEALRQRTERAGSEDSRLFAINAAPDRVTLEQRYAGSDMHLILPATVKPWLHCKQPAAVYVTRLHGDRVHVPKQHRAAFGNPGRRRADRRPGYRAEIAYGRLAEPWVVNITLSKAEADNK